jgi:hypothetical protein
MRWCCRDQGTYFAQCSQVRRPNAKPRDNYFMGL